MKAVCDVCGFVFKEDKLKQRWDGFMVCDKDWEVRHPMDFFKAKPDKSINAPWVNPPPEEISVAPTYTYTPDPPPPGTFNQGL